MRRAASLLTLAVLVAGCAAGSGPDAELPGVYTDSRIHDEFSCAWPLGVEGCAVVRFPEVHSGCEPEVPGYVVCNGTVEWAATAGASAPGARLVVLVNGTQVDACEAPCRLEGNASFVHHFGEAGARHPWNVSVLASVDAPADAPVAASWFRLTAEFVVRTEPPGSLAV